MWKVALLSAAPIRVYSGSPNRVFAARFVFGLKAFPIFSISAAYANDFATPDQAIALSAALMFLWGLGAIATPDWLV